MGELFNFIPKKSQNVNKHDFAHLWSLEALLVVSDTLP